eukprot:5086898-Ditylum_brightwellii.AAC.1
MPQRKNGVTAEMQTEDHYCISINKKTVCLWNKGFGKEVPKKHCNITSYLGFQSKISWLTTE